MQSYLKNNPKCYLSFSSPFVLGANLRYKKQLKSVVLLLIIRLALLLFMANNFLQKRFREANTALFTLLPFYNA